MDSLASLHLQYANLGWNSEAMPESVDYGDVYFSRASAPGESTHVFLSGNALQARFTALQAGSHFSIGELGFGSGLNFLNTCQLWDSTAPDGSTLHYVACELHPMRRDDLLQLHRSFPDLLPFSNQLLKQYPAHTAGVHQLRLGINNKQILLTLLYGEAASLLGSYADTARFRIDAWFLDGFSPKLNPGLWLPSLFRTLAILSKPGTTLSTYSVAAAVRSGLKEAGFSLEKSPGYGTKRHMLKGYMGPSSKPANTPSLASRTVLVVGGGLAGCSTAFALAESGWQVSLLDRAPAVATQASGNPQGILHFRPVKHLAPDNHFNLFAYLFASRFYHSLQDSHNLQWHKCGHLQLGSTAKLLERFQAIMREQLYPVELMQLLTAEQASSLAGVQLRYPALFFPDSGWLCPPDLCSLYVNHPAITLHTGTDVQEYRPRDSGWAVDYRQNGLQHTLTADALVLANSADASLFPQLRHLPLISNRGQVDIYQGAPVQTRTVICGQSYLVPEQDSLQSIGGSYFLGDHSEDARLERSKWHMDQLADLSPEAASRLRAGKLPTRRTGTRCITPDRLPLVGPVHRNLPGLYLNLAHGSHGLTRTPICAYLLASLMNDTPPPGLRGMDTLLNPQRYPAD